MTMRKSILAQALGAVLSPAMSFPLWDTSRGGDWSMQDLFPAGTPGLWYRADEPSKLSVARRNLFGYSERLDYAMAWNTAPSASVTGTSVAAPDGTPTAIKIADANTDNAFHYTLHALPLPALSVGEAGTVSIYAKKAEYNFLRIYVNQACPDTSSFFNLDTGTLGFVTPGHTCTITPVGDGWYRCTLSIVATNNAQLNAYIGYTPIDGDVYHTGIVGQGIYIWGAQNERGAAATTYQKVTNWSDEYQAAASGDVTNFQDAGLAVTGVEQAVGLVLDRHKGLKDGPNLIPAWASWTVGPNTAVEIKPNGNIRISAIATGGATPAITIIVPNITVENAHFSVNLVGESSHANCIFDGYFVASGGYAGAWGTNWMINGPGLYSGIQTPAAPLLGTSTDQMQIQFRCFHSQGPHQAGDWIELSPLEVHNVSGTVAAQYTAAARLRLSARTNHLLATDGHAGGIEQAIVVMATGLPDQKGNPTARQIRNTTADAQHRIFTPLATTPSVPYTVYVKNVDAGFIQLSYAGLQVSTACVNFNLNTGTVDSAFSTHGVPTGTITQEGEFWKCTLTPHAMEQGIVNVQFYVLEAGGQAMNVNFPGTEKSVIVGGAMLGDGPYQWVKTDSNYDTTNFLHYLKADGIDDGLVAGPFAAGTLTSNMDLMMLVRRDSESGTTVLGANEAGYTNLFGMFGAGGTGIAHLGAVGTPTYAVNGVQVPGGTAVTRGDLFEALGGFKIGKWNILEIRGLDLSTWTQLRLFGGGLPLNGAVPEMTLVPSMSPAQRYKALQYFGQRAGVPVTLPAMHLEVGFTPAEYEPGFLFFETAEGVVSFGDLEFVDPAGLLTEMTLSMITYDGTYPGTYAGTYVDFGAPTPAMTAAIGPLPWEARLYEGPTLLGITTIPDDAYNSGFINGLILSTTQDITLRVWK